MIGNRNVNHERTYLDEMSAVLEVFRIDLSNYVHRLSQRYVNMLFPPVPGVYLRGTIIPFLSFYPDGPGYFSHQAFMNRESAPDIHCFKDVWKSNGPVYDLQGRVVLNNVAGIQHLYSEYPFVHSGAIYVAYIYAYEEARRYSREYNPTTNLDKEYLDLRNHVLPEFMPQQGTTYDDYINNRTASHFMDEDNEDLIYLGAELRAIFSRNIYSTWRLHLNDTILTIERGQDYRVIGYYKMIADHMNSISNA